MKDIHPNEFDRRRIEAAFPSLMPDQVRNECIECKGGYILAERRPFWRHKEGEGERPWITHEFAKFVYVGSKKVWKLSGRRADGKWESFRECSDLEEAIAVVKRNPVGCFFG